MLSMCSVDRLGAAPLLPSRRADGAAVTHAPAWRHQQLHRIAQKSRRCAPCVRATAATTEEQPTTAAPAPAANAAPAAAAAAPSTSGLTYTSYEGNSFAVKFVKTGINVLVDPWLVDKLTFGGLDFIYAGSKRVARPEVIGDLDKLAAETDVLVLSQGIDDHAHRPTLQRLPKTLPVVASAAGAAVARSLGFRTVYTLRPGQSIAMCRGALTIRATAGALVGPPWSQRELGVVLQENLEGGARGASLYYEPHADYVEESVASVAPVDVVVSPPCSQILMGYTLVKGATDTLSLLKLLKPKVYVPLNNAEFDQSGPLADLLEEQGSAQQMQAQLASDPATTGMQVVVPVPAQPMAVKF